MINQLTNQMLNLEDVNPVNLNCGKVYSYDASRGFGFVECLITRLNGSCWRRVFFHASKVKEWYEKLNESVDRVSQDDVMHRLMNGAFWYETEYTRKGEAVKRIFTSDEIEQLKNAVSSIIDKESIYKYFSRNIVSYDKNDQNVKLIEIGFGREIIDRLDREREKYDLEQKELRERLEKENEQRVQEKKERLRKCKQQATEDIGLYDVYIDGGLDPDVAYAYYWDGDCIVRFKSSGNEYKYSLKRAKIVWKELKDDRRNRNSSKFDDLVNSRNANQIEQDVLKREKGKDCVVSFKSLLDELFESAAKDSIKKVKEAKEGEKLSDRSEEEQYQALVEKMRPKNFTLSHEVSMYIIQHKLHEKYGKLAGNLELEKNGSSFTYRGGISPAFYARLCQDLNLGDKNSGARIIGFTSYERMKK